VFSNVKNEGAGIDMVISRIIVWAEAPERTAGSLSAKWYKGAGRRKLTEQREYMHPGHPCRFCSSHTQALFLSSPTSGHQHLQSGARGTSYGSPGDGWAFVGHPSLASGESLRPRHRALSSTTPPPPSRGPVSQPRGNKGRIRWLL